MKLVAGVTTAMSAQDIHAALHLPQEIQIPGINADLPELTLKNVVSFIAATAMVFGGVVPFIPQYRDIKKSGNAEGFSTFVCLTLLIANILRIMFWFGKHFEMPLLAQSYIMVVTMLVMVRLCVHVKAKTELIASKNHKFTANYQSQGHQTASDINRSGHRSNRPSTFFEDVFDVKVSGISNHAIRRDLSCHEIPVGEPLPESDKGDSPDQRDVTLLKVKQHNITDFDRSYFWRWTDFTSYVEFSVVFTIAFSVLTYLLLDNVIYIETVGFMAVFCEAMLGAPQFYRNFQNKSTQGMSKKMVGMWTCGDVFKTMYFILREAPPQFWICGMLQVSIDISIFLQVFCYRNLPSKSPKTYR